MMWKKAIRILFNWFFFLLFLAMAMFTLFTLSIGIFDIDELDEPQVIEEIFTKKGVYGGLQYYVQLSDSAEQRIFKKDFFTYEKGMEFTPSLKTFTVKDWFLFVGIFVLLFFIFIALVYLFAGRIFSTAKWFQWIERMKEKCFGYVKQLCNKEILKQIWMIFIILTCSSFLLFVGKNSLHAVLPFGKVFTEAEVVDAERQRIQNPKTSSTRYSVTYQYTDVMGREYKTEKRVSKKTYNQYKNQMYIPIAYSKNAPENPFISWQSVGEFLSVLISRSTFGVLAVIFILTYVIKKYRTYRSQR